MISTKFGAPLLIIYSGQPINFNHCFWQEGLSCSHPEAWRQQAYSSLLLQVGGSSCWRNTFLRHYIFMSTFWGQMECTAKHSTLLDQVPPDTSVVLKVTARASWQAGSFTKQTPPWRGACSHVLCAVCWPDVPLPQVHPLEGFRPEHWSARHCFLAAWFDVPTGDEAGSDLIPLKSWRDGGGRHPDWAGSRPSHSSTPLPRKISCTLSLN